MALETLRYHGNIGGFNIMDEADIPRDHDHLILEDECDEMLERNPIVLDHEENIIAFKIQKGAVEEVGQNGCELDTLIETAKIMLEGLNEKMPCDENYQAIGDLVSALKWLKKRKLDRIKRGVEGYEIE